MKFPNCYLSICIVEKDSLTIGQSLVETFWFEVINLDLLICVYFDYLCCKEMVDSYPGNGIDKILCVNPVATREVLNNHLASFFPVSPACYCEKGPKFKYQITFLLMR